MAKKKNNIEISMEENIRNYANEITTLDSFVKAVRKLPGMYIGNIGNPGFLTMIKEIFQNSLDEVMRRKSPCDMIRISYDERTHETIIEDNGRGIPFSKMIDIYTKEHTSTNYEKEDFDYTAGVHGVGGKVTNALSAIFIVESYILGKAKRIEFIDGIPSSEEPVDIPNTENKQGTIVRFRPSYEALGEVSLKIEPILELIKGMLSKTTLGTRFEFNGIFLDGTPYHEVMVNEDGLLSYIIMKTINPLIKPIMYAEDTGKMKAEIVFTYDSNDLQDANISTFANFCNVTDGPFKTGFEQGLCNFFRNYVNKIYLANNKKVSIVNVDIMVGLKAVINVAHLNPIFTGQAKERLGNEDMLPFIRDLTLKSLNKWSKENPQDLQRICKYLKDVAEIRLKSEGEKIKLGTRYESSSISGLPSKYEKPIGNSNLEFLIVEGDSAKGPANEARCKKRQGVFPIRGKLPNALTTEKSKFLKNPEVDAIITIIGGGYGRSFDISKVKWEKIIFMADADVDGLHIRTLLLKFILMYMPQLIEDGRVYSAVPPLYGVRKKKGMEYFTNRLDYVMYIQKIFTKNNTVATLRGNVLTQKEITDLLYRNTDYVYDIETLSNRYAINPCLLELVVINLNKDEETIRQIVMSTYRFMKVYNKNNVIIIEGLIDSKYQTLFLNEQFKTDVFIIQQYVNNNSNMYYNINNEKKSLYEIMKIYESSSPSNINRYKGLGEMNAKQLAESTLHPDSPYRTLLRYTVESAKEELEMIKYLESNKQELIKDVKVSRIDLMN